MGEGEITTRNVNGFTVILPQLSRENYRLWEVQLKQAAHIHGFPNILVADPPSEDDKGFRAWDLARDNMLSLMRMSTTNVHKDLMIFGFDFEEQDPSRMFAVIKRRYGFTPMEMAAKALDDFLDLRVNKFKSTLAYIEKYASLARTIDASPLALPDRVKAVILMRQLLKLDRDGLISLYWQVQEGSVTYRETLETVSRYFRLRQI